MRLAGSVRLATALFVASLGLAPSAALAHDAASGSPDVTVRIGAGGVSDHSVSVPAGGLVAFVNGDDERHRLRSRTKPGEFDTGDLEPGERRLVRFATPGTVRYADERSGGAAFSGTIRVGDAGSASSGSAPATATQGATVKKAATVTIANRAFSPGTVTIAAGGTVTWVNRDDREHTATSSGGSPISSPVLGAGDSYRKAFAQPGTYAFLCAIHSDMRGTVRVVAASGGVPPAATKPAPAPTALPAPKPSPTAAIAAAPDGAEQATIVDFAFDPAPLVVPAGTTVTWVNRGAAPHTVTAGNGSFDSGLIAAGASFARVFETPGSYAFACSFHPEMRGTVTVEAAPVASGPEPTPAPVPTPTPTPEPTASATAEAAAVAPPSGSPPVGGSASTPAVADDAPAAASNDAALPIGQVAVIAVVVSINAWAFWLFSRTVTGAARRAS